MLTDEEKIGWMKLRKGLLEEMQHWLRRGDIEYAKELGELAKNIKTRT